MPAQPISFQALTSRLITPDVDERPTKKQVIGSMIPSMLEHDKDNDEPIPNAVRVSSEEDKSGNAEQTNVATGNGNRALPQYYDDVFNSRGPLNPPGATSVHESIVVIEIKTNTKVTRSFVVWNVGLGTDLMLYRPRKKSSDSCLIFRFVWHKSTSDPRHP